MEDVLTALRSRPSTLGAPTGTTNAKPRSDNGAGDAWTRAAPGNPFTLSATARPFTQHGGPGSALPAMAPPAPRPSTAAAPTGAGTPDAPPALALRPSTALNVAAPPPRPKTSGAVPRRTMPQAAGENADMDVVGDSERTSPPPPAPEPLPNDIEPSLQRHLAAVTRLHCGAAWTDELIVQAVRSTPPRAA